MHHNPVSKRGRTISNNNINNETQRNLKMKMVMNMKMIMMMKTMVLKKITSIIRTYNMFSCRKRFILTVMITPILKLQ